MASNYKINDKVYSKDTIKIPLENGTGYAVFGYTGDETNGTEPPVETTTYKVTYNLTSVTSSNTATTVTEGASYITVLSSDSTIDSVVVKMGGVDITETAYNSTSKTITISEVAGDIEITASIADSSLLYTLKDASFNGQTAVDTGVALFDKSRDFTILLDFEDYDAQAKSPVIGIYDETNTLDSQKYFIVKGDYIDKNLETQKSRMSICIGDGTTTWAEYSDYSDSYNNISGAFKIAITRDSASEVWSAYTYNVNSDKRLDPLFDYKYCPNIENTLSLGFASYRGYCAFTLNECSIYNRVLSEDEINTWLQ